MFQLYNNIFFRLPGTGWYNIMNEDINQVWAPEIIFRNVIESEILTNWGKGQMKFAFWFQSSTGKLTFSKTMKITFTCDFHFENYVIFAHHKLLLRNYYTFCYSNSNKKLQPFDSHHCDFDFGILGYSNLSVIFAPVKVLTPESTKPKLLENEIVIPNIHLPYSFTMTSKELYEVPHVGYSSPHIGVTINIKREKLDQLIGGFYIPMTIFAFLSMISFFINPEAVSYIFSKLYFMFTIM